MYSRSPHYLTTSIIMNKIFITTASILSLLVFLLPAKNVFAEDMESNCRVQIKTPLSSVPILFPLKITGELVAQSSTCNKQWSFSETELGTIVVLDANDVPITEEMVVPLHFIAPVVYPQSFSAVVRLKDLKPSTSTGSIVVYDRDITDADGDERQETKYSVLFGEDAHFSYYFAKKMKYGMKNDGDVKKLQEVLISRGYLKGTATGNFLSGTKKAVIEYQKDHNLPATGICGDMTRVLLNDNE